MSRAVSPSAITLPVGLSLADAMQLPATSRCSVGLFCGDEGAELHRHDSIVSGACCCCRAGTRDHP